MHAQKHPLSPLSVSAVCQAGKVGNCWPMGSSQNLREFAYFWVNIRHKRWSDGAAIAVLLIKKGSAERWRWNTKPSCNNLHFMEYCTLIQGFIILAILRCVTLTPRISQLATLQLPSCYSYCYISVHFSSSWTLFGDFLNTALDTAAYY